MNGQPQHRIEIRPAHRGDDRAVTNLAQRDSARVPTGPLVLGFEDGELRAAISLTTGTWIADPFSPTVQIVQMLLLQTPWARNPRPRRLLAGPRVAATAPC
jgi:hypothetical protein